MLNDFKIWSFLSIFLVVSEIFGQNTDTGKLSGTVIDTETNEPLAGVNIILVGTVLGTSTDLDGEFNLTGIQRGIYSIKASMIGYKTQTFEKVTIAPGAPAILNFKLEESFIEISPVVVTASKRSKSLSETPNSVSIVSARDIRKRNSFDVRDALKYAPGVSFVGSQVNIRGTTGYSRGAGSRVLLLTDGVPTMPGDSGDIKWDVVPFTVVDKIEVVKGAASALYGSSAISGVLNIITKEPSSKPELSLRLSGGVYDASYFKEWDWTNKTLYTNQQDVYYSNSAGDLGYILSFGRRQSRGYKQDSQFLRWNVFGKTDYKLSSNSNLTLTGSFASDDHGEAILWQKYLGQSKQPFLVPEQDVNNTIISRKLFVNTTFSNLVSQDFAHKFKLSYYRNRFDNDIFENKDFSKSQRFRGEYQADLEPSVHHSLTLGFEGIYDKINGSFFGNREAYVIAPYLQDEVKFTDRFSTTLGLRFDYNKVVAYRTEYQVSPKFGLVYNISDLTNLKASIGRGFRAPAIAELFSNSQASGFLVVPNPHLKAESSWSAEVGLTTSIRNHVSLDVAVYQERYFDFINPSLNFEETLLVRFENVQDARIRGLEANVTSSWLSNRLNSIVSYIFVDPRDLETDALLTYRPQHIFTASLTAKPGIFELGVDFRYASRLKQEQVEVFPQDERVPTKVWDARVGLSSGKYTLMFNVENVFQYHYTQIERNLEPIRQFSLTWQADF